MKSAIIAILAGILLFSGTVASSQDYQAYQFRGVPACDADMKKEFLDFLIDIAATNAIGETPEAYADTVKSEAEAQLREQLASQLSSQRMEAQEVIAGGLQLPSAQYNSSMKPFWDRPILCKQALETVQLIVEHQVRVALISYGMYMDEQETSLFEIIKVVNDEFIPDPYPRMLELVGFFASDD